MATSTKKNTMTKKKLINSISQDKGIHPNDVGMELMYKLRNHGRQATDNCTSTFWKCS